MLSDLSDISERLTTQGNQCTAEPMFCVQEKRREYGFDTRWTDDTVWLDPDECSEVEEDYPRAIKTGYKDTWETVTVCFTEKGCQDYIQGNKHRHQGELRIFVESFYRNEEMIRIRKALMEEVPVR